VERKTGRSFTILNLGQIVALAPNMVVVTVANVGDSMQHVVAAKHELQIAPSATDGVDTAAAASTKAAPKVETYSLPRTLPPQLQGGGGGGGSGGGSGSVNRAQQAADFKRRSQTFRCALVDAVKRHIADQVSALPQQKVVLAAADIRQVPVGFDPESVPDIVPFNLPRIEDFRSAHSSKVLKSKASEASAASIAASTAAAVLAMKAGGGKPKSTSLLERIREKEKAKKEEDAFKNPNEKRIGQMAQLIKEVLMLVWSKKPKNGKGCSSVAYPQLCADLRRSRRRPPRWNPKP